MSNSYTPEEPIAAIATALAPSALAIIRVSGKNCIELLSKVFSRPKALSFSISLDSLPKIILLQPNSFNNCVVSWMISSLELSFKW